MRFRSLLLLPIVATVFSLAPPAHADVPAPSSSSSGTGGATTAAGTGGEANCTVAYEESAFGGSMCVEVTCDPTCSGVPSGYNQVCASSATKQVYCNGPVRDAPSDQNAACAVSMLGGSRSGVVAGGALALAIALGAWRRRRS